MADQRPKVVGKISGLSTSSPAPAVTPNPQPPSPKGTPEEPSMLLQTSAPLEDTWKPNFDYYEQKFVDFETEKNSLAYTCPLSIVQYKREPRTTKISVPEDLLVAAKKQSAANATATPSPALSPAPGVGDSVAPDAVALAAAELFTQPWVVVSMPQQSQSSGPAVPPSSTSPTPGASSSKKGGFPSSNFPAPATSHSHERRPSFVQLDTKSELQDLTFDEPNAPIQTSGTLEEIPETEIKSETFTPPPTVPRPSIFRVFPMPAPDSYTSPQQMGTPSFSRHGVEFMVQFRDIKFDLGVFEPFFGVMFLYDLATEEKLSENFYFHSTTPSPPMQQCIFHVEQPKHTIWLVVTLFHAIRGDYDAALDPYFKQLSAKDQTKFAAEIAESSSRMANFKQVFAWGATPLFSELGYLTRSGETTITNFSRVKEDLSTFLNKLASDKDAKRTKPIPGKMSIILEKFERNRAPYNILDPLLLPVVPQDDRKPEEKPSSYPAAMYEVLRFVMPTDMFVPNLDYMNVLYFYPEQLNFNNYKGADSSARNIQVSVKLMETDLCLPDRAGLKACFGPDYNLHEEARFSLQYHVKRPKFSPFDEVKILLPHTVTKSHHLMVTFYHIDCKVKKGKSDQEQVLGYCAIPLLEASGDFIKDERKVKPVAVTLPAAYLQVVGTDFAAKNQVLKWVEGGKPVFSFKTRLVSSVHTQDHTLRQLLRISRDLVNDGKAATVEATVHEEGTPQSSDSAQHDESDITLENLSPFQAALKILRSVEAIPVAELTRFFPLVANKLIELMSAPDIDISADAWKAFVSVTKIVDMEAKRKPVRLPILESYVEYMYKESHLEGVMNHKSILTNWLNFLLASDKDPEGNKNLGLNYTWFFLAIIFKDLVLHYNRGPAAPILGKPERRAKKIPELIVAMLHRLIVYLSAKVVILRIEYNLAKEVNRSVAFFLRHLLDLLDRGEAFSMIYDYIANMEKNSFTELQELRFVAIRILADHDQYVALNLPVPEKISTSDLYNSFFQRHFLSGLLMREVRSAVRSGEPYTRSVAISSLRDVIWKHDRDARYLDLEKRRRIGSLYFPFIPLCAEHFPVLFPKEKVLSSSEKDEARQWLVCLLYTLRDSEHTLFADWFKAESKKTQQAVLELLERITETFKYPGKENCVFSFSSTAALLEESNVPDTSKETESNGEKEAAPPPQTRNIVDPTLRSFARSKKASNAAITRQDAKALLEEKYSTLHMGTTVDPRHRLSSISRESSLGMFGSGEYTPRAGSHQIIPDSNELTLMYKHLSLESSMVVLEKCVQSIGEITEPSRKKSSSGKTVPVDVQMLQKAFDVLVPLFGREQCHQFLMTFFVTAHLLLKAWRKEIFGDPTTICQGLTQKVMEHCCNYNTAIRMRAASLLGKMIVLNYNESHNFARMKLQCTIAVSKIVGDFRYASSNFEPLLQCLEAVSKFLVKLSVKHSSDQMATFPFKQEMPELRQRLGGVIKDSMLIQEHKHDEEMTADIYHQISKGYIDSPDIRIAWLENIAKLHAKTQNWEECAQVYILMAALAARYVLIIRDFPVDIPASSWLHVFPNFERECTMPPEQNLKSVKNEICMGEEFTPQGYKKLIHQAVAMLLKVSNWEQCVEAFQLLIPVLRANRDYQSQAVVYQQLHEMCLKTVAENKSNTRVPPNYYRVAFYGPGFGDNSGKAYVYKQSCFVRIADFTERIKMQYEGKFQFEVITNSKDIKDLDSKKNYIQIGAVLAVVDDKQQGNFETNTLISQHFNVSRFMMEVPFAKAPKSGPLTGAITEQWKRRVFLTIEGSFPYLKKRSPVVKVEENIITPVQCAIDLIQDKTADIEKELNKPNTKTLQFILQGTLLACVNVGPLEICRVFLLGDSTKLDPAPQAADIQKLTEAMGNFIRKLGFAVVMNGKLAPDQAELQVELERSYASFKDLFSKVGMASSSPALSADE